MHPLDSAANARFTIDALAAEQGGSPLHQPDPDRDPDDDLPDDLAEERIADHIANLLHLAQQFGLDPHETLEKGRGYFEGDAEQKFWPFDGEGALHGSPAELAIGTVLKPGPAMHHIFCTLAVDTAVEFGRQKAKDPHAKVHVYAVTVDKDALRNEAGDILANHVVIDSVIRTKEGS